MRGEKNETMNVAQGSAAALPDSPVAKATQSKREDYNPYLAARREWDERYGDLLARAKRAERIALICAGIALLITPGFVVLALRPPRIVVVAVNAAGEYLGSGASGNSVMVTEEMKRAALSDWVSNLRMVTSDGMSQRRAIEKVYAMISSGSPAQTFVSDFYRGNPPQSRAQSEMVHVQVNTVLSTSKDTDKDTYQVEWMETTRDLQGKVLFEQRWKGAFTFVISPSPPHDERLVRLNPIGLYITQASWSRVL
jgi:type IV secretion system protein VirB5